MKRFVILLAILLSVAVAPPAGAREAVLAWLSALSKR